MLFKKNATPRCACCVHASEAVEGSVLCEKRGLMDAGASCRRFRYDPLKRTPLPLAGLSAGALNKEDFQL